MNETNSRHKVLSAAAWVLQILIALQFILSGSGKFLDGESWERRFRGWGYPDNFYLIVGAIELALAVLLFVPKTWRIATLCTVLFMIGAAATHLRAGDGHHWAAVIIGALAALTYAFRVKLEKQPAAVQQT